MDGWVSWVCEALVVCLELEYMRLKCTVCLSFNHHDSLWNCRAAVASIVRKQLWKEGVVYWLPWKEVVVEHSSSTLIPFVNNLSIYLPTIVGWWDDEALAGWEWVYVWRIIPTFWNNMLHKAIIVNIWLAYGGCFLLFFLCLQYGNRARSNPYKWWINWSIRDDPSPS